jgi:ATP-binding cassette subfamily C protein CydC
LETFLGEAGALISGGQAQRIALARVLVADRHMIVLDEPTAELNSELANHLMSDILEATRDRILVILSHTPVTRVRATTEISLD